MKRFSVLQRQFWLSGIMLLLFSALLQMAAVLPLKDYRKPHFSASGLDEAGTAARADRLHKKGAIGSEENPEARLEYEVDRLKDPATGMIPFGIRERELAYSMLLPTAEQVDRQKNPYVKHVQAVWDRRGPFNVGGRTRALGLDISNENVILAAGVSGGMWRTSNGGNSWSKVTDPNQLHSVTTVAQDRRAGKRNTWYYGSGELSGNSASKTGATYYGNGIYKSIDNGVTWNSLPFTTTPVTTTFNSVFQFVHRVATNPANTIEDEVFAATIGGIQRSVDGGNTWLRVLGTDDVSETTTNPFFTYVAVSNGGVKYAGLSSQSNGTIGGSTTKGIFRSMNGVNWANITPAGFPATYGRIVMDIYEGNENIVYFFVYTTTNSTHRANLWKYEYVSGDGSGNGGSWTNLTDNLPMLGGTSGNLDLQGGYNMVVKIKPNDPEYVVLGGTNLYRSLDGFTSTGTTSKIGGYIATNASYALYPNHHPDQHEFLFYPSSPNRSLSGHDGGVSRTANNLVTSITWESLNRGYQTTQFYTVAMDLNTSDDFVVGGLQDNGTWSVDNINEQTVWRERVGGDGAFAAVTTHSLLASVQNGTVYRFAYDDAGGYQGYARIDPPTGKGYLFINPYTVNPNNEYNLFIPAGDTLWRNKDISRIPITNTATQSAIGWEVVTNLADTEVISSVSVSTVPANVVYFGTRAGKLYKFENGIADTPVRTNVTGSNFPNGNISCIAIDPRDANKAVVVFTNYRVQSLFYTTDGGTSWTAVSGNLEEGGNPLGNGPSTRWVTILPDRNGGTKYFVATSTGLYSTGVLTGSSTTWVREGSSTIGLVPIDMVLSRTTDNQVLVGTHGNGVYSRRYNEPLASKEEIAAASAFGLKHSYPNPFRQGALATVPFTLEKAGDVNLTVYDLTGKAVTTLVKGRKAAGHHQVTWDGRGAAGQTVPSGTYLFQLVADGKRYTKRMVFYK